MPIVGMTRRQDVEEATHRLVYGTLRKGGPKPDAKRPGPELEYWRFTSERPDLVAAFAAAYPDKPKAVDAYLPFPDMERNWQTWYEEYDAGGLRHRCDGRTMYRWRKQDGSYQDGEQPCPYFAGRERTAQNPGCKQVGRLYLVLPALIKAGFVGLVTMETHSINDLISITTSLMDIEKKTGGRLSGILLSVIRVKETISTPAWQEADRAAGKRNRTAKNLVKVVPQAEWVMAHLQVEAQEQMALAQGKPLELERRSSNAADDWDEDDEDGNEDDNPPGMNGDLPEFAEPALPDTSPDADDIEEGDFTPEPVTDFPGSHLKLRLHEQATAGITNGAIWKGELTSPENVKKINTGLAILLPNAEQRHRVREYLLGHDSSAYTKGEIAALVGWLDMRKDVDGATVPSAQAIADAKMLIAFLCPPEPELFPDDAAAGK
jgi:hypothetical protein